MGFIDHTASRTSAAAHTWVKIPITERLLRPTELAGFDTLDQALAVVAGLSGPETARAI